MNSLKRFQEDERGATMIIAIMVSFIVLTLSMTVVSLSLHGQDQSANDRRRVQAISASEAGVDYFFSYLQATGGLALACAGDASLTRTLTTSPPSTFTVTPFYFDASGNVLACPLAVVPSYVRVKSVGSAGGAASVRRTMEAYSKLTVSQTGTFDNSGAIFANSSVSFSANAQVGGNQYNDADVYSNGSVAMSANSTLYGRVYAQGSVTLGSNSEAKRDVWANGSVTMQGNARARENVTSSTSSISMTTQSRIYGNARAGTTISSQGVVDGTRTPNAPSPAPPTRAYPIFTYSASDWASAGYTVRTYTNCTTAATDISSWWGTTSGSNVVRITGGCALSLSNTTMYGSLAIVNDGSILLPTNTRITVATGTGPWDLFFFAGLAGAPGCQFSASSNSGAGLGASTLIYVPQACTVDIQSNSVFAQGQVMGGTVNFKHSASFQFRRLTIPGTGVGGFLQDVVYRREIANGT